MRENIGIFKGKTRSGGLWVEGSLIQKIDEEGNVTAWIGSPRPFAMPHEVDPETVCEFTGLTDKNGKPIYEGDIHEIDKWNRFVVRFGEFYNDDLEDTGEEYHGYGWYLERLDRHGNLTGLSVGFDGSESEYVNIVGHIEHKKYVSATPSCLKGSEKYRCLKY